ncbi:MAG: PAS domain S-box protein [Desulfobulbaceae bacterium]|nr:PAS domain S-box protein [Desulfobulbaceae bacterium]
MRLHDARHFLFGTLRGRLILGVAIVHAVLMTLFIADLTVRYRTLLLEHQQEDAMGMAQALATSAAGWIEANDISGLQELVESERRYPELVFAILTDDAGQILAHTDKIRKGQYLLDLSGKPEPVLIGKTQNLVDVAVPAMLGGRLVGWARVGIGQQRAAGMIARITRNGELYGLAAIVLGSIIAWLLGRHITGRLYVIQAAINRVHAGDRRARAPVIGEDEAALMAREFNAMLDMLAARDADLAAREEDLRHLIEYSPVALAVTGGTDNRLEVMSKKFTGLFGYTLEDLPDVEHWWPLAYPDPEYRAKVKTEWGAKVEEALKVKGVIKPMVPMEAMVTCKDGSQRDIEFHMSSIGDGMLTTFVDITERKQAERALRTSEEFLESVVENIPNMIFVKEAKGLRFVRLNKAGEELIGYQRHELYGKNDYDFFSKEEAEFFTKNDREVLDSRKIVDIPEEVIETRHQGKRILHTKKIPLVDAQGHPQYLLGISEDITDRKQAEQALEKVALEWSAAMDASEDAIYLLDLQRRVLRGNKTFHKMTRTTPATARGQHITDLMHKGGEEVPCPVCLVQEELREAVIVMEGEHPHNPGGKPLEITLRIVRDEAARPVSILTTLHDLSPDRKIQEELERYREHLEELVGKRTAEVEVKNAELERLNKLFVGRELRMIELKERIKELEKHSE